MVGSNFGANKMTAKILKRSLMESLQNMYSNKMLHVTALIIRNKHLRYELNYDQKPQVFKNLLAMTQKQPLV